MRKMARSTPKLEKMLINEIYRVCRLCGAITGYKMPIIRNHHFGKVEMKHKIRECVQIEVHQDDKMPTLICELCWDKVNNFYEFMEICRQTDKAVRLRLGLPPQTLPRGAPDAGDCILGVTEPIIIDEDSNEPIQRSKGKTLVKNAKKKDSDSPDTKSSKMMPTSSARAGPPPPNSPRILRSTKRTHEDDVSLLEEYRGRPAKKVIKVECRVCSMQFLNRELRSIHRCSGAAPQVQVQRISKCDPLPEENKLGVDYSDKPTNNSQKVVKGRPAKKVIKVECRVCSMQFLNRELRSIHRCSGAGLRPGQNVCLAILT